ncbi:MAG: MFS transporter [Promethearchaeota archaeon]
MPKSYIHTKQIWVKEIPKQDKRFKSLNLNYIGFFSFYFSISVIRIILSIYLPAYLLNILNINRSNLAFVQIFTYSVMLLAPVLGYLYDKFSRSRKVLMFSFSITLIVSFFLLIFTFNSLFIFGLIFALNLLSQQIVTVGVSKYVVLLSHNETIKDSNLTVVNISANIGSLVPSIIFLFTVQNLYNTSNWNNFFLIGVICALPIIFLTVFLKNECSENSLNPTFENPNLVLDKNSSKKSLYLQIFLIFLSYTLIWSDYLYQYPISSWIITKYGENGFNVYSISFFFFIILNCLGVLIGKWNSKRINSKLYNTNLKHALLIKHKKRIIFITITFYIGVTTLMSFANFYILLICFGIINILAGIMLLNYVSLMMTITKNFKYKTFAYQVLTLALAVSSVIFIPLGTFCSLFIPTEILFLIVCFLSFLSTIPLIFIESK